MRIESGSTTRYLYFVAVDATDLKTRETGLSSFTVYRSRNGAAAAAMTTPTVNETDATNMPGVYELLLDEDTTIGAGNDTEELVVHITATGMAPVTRSIELYRPETTAGSTSTAQTGDNYARLGSPAGASIAADIATVDTVADAIKVVTDAQGSTGSGLSAVPWNASWDAEVQSEVADGLTAFWTSPATLVDLIWDEPQAGHTTASTFGKYLDTEVSGVGGGGGDATAANQTTIINHLTDVKGTGFVKDTHSLTDILTDVTGLNGDAMRGTDSAFLAASAPTNFSSLVISGAGAVDALTQGYLNTLLTETTGGRIAGNFDTFFENGDAATSQTVDDVGSGAGTVNANITQIEGHALAGTGTQIADAFEYFFNIASPSKTVNDVGVAGSGITQQEVRDAMKLAPTAGTPSAGSIDEHLDDVLEDTGTTIPGTITTIDTNVDAILVDTGTTLPATLATIDGNVDAILVDTGTTLEGHLTDIKGGTFSGVTDSLEAIRNQGDSAWITATGFSTHAAADVTTHMDSNSTQLSTLVSNLSTVDTNVTSILADTNELQTDWANGGRLDLILDSVLSMLDDGRTEPGQGAPPVNPDAMTKIDFLYKAWRNKKTQTASTMSLFADDGTTVHHTATLSDDGTTATVGEVS